MAVEIGALKRLSHRHLVKIKGTYTDPSCFAFLMEPVAPFNLYQWLVRLGPDQLPTLRNFFGCLANAVVYLHKEKVYRMDINLDNILVGSSQQVFLADFGAAHGWSQKDGSTTWAAIPRTVKYMPPELALDANAPKRYSIDIWSLRVVFLEMVTVLRGAKLGGLADFLAFAGNKSKYVYSNPVATNQWLERLRAREAPEYETHH